ncbi:type I restriction-modification system subunit M N-terminal domain-containing protein [Enterobacter hormaechei]|nr:type I restriction-modification system subunit M N-terminal domain-containing protein [Enterobacter hormaechei]
MLWDTANQLRGSVESSEYKHVVLSLVFLKFISDKFESHRKKMFADEEQKCCNGKKISWNDFFYDEDRYPVLFKKADKITHPVAILITVKDAQKHINTEKSNFYSLKGELCTLEHEDKSKEFFAPGLTCNDTTFFEKLEAKDEIIVIGKVRPIIKQWSEGKIFKNLNINVFNKKQITRLKD